MQNLTKIHVRRLRVAAARLRETRRRSGTDRAIWLAARNYRRDAIADPAEAPQVIELPQTLTARIAELTMDVTDDRIEGSEAAQLD